MCSHQEEKTEKMRRKRKRRRACYREHIGSRWNKKKLVTVSREEDIEKRERERERSGERETKSGKMI